MGTFDCPSCGRQLNITASMAGQTITCPCHREFVVPWTDEYDHTGDVVPAARESLYRNRRRTRNGGWLLAGLAVVAILGLAGLAIPAILFNAAKPPVREPAKDLAIKAPVDVPGPRPEDVAVSILAMYQREVDDPSRWPSYGGRPIAISKDPRENVRLAIELAKKGKPNARTVRALQQAQTLISQRAVVDFLSNLDEASFEKITKPGGEIRIPLAKFDAWSQGAGTRDDDPGGQPYFRMIRRMPDEVRLYHVLDYASMIDAAFLATIRDSIPAAESRRAEIRAERIARREPNPTLTTSLFKVHERLDEYLDKCMVFDNLKVHGGARRLEIDGVPSQEFYYLPVTDERGEFYGGGFLNDELVFVCSKQLADSWREALGEDDRVMARVCCQVGTNSRGAAILEIYNLRVYDRTGVLRFEFTPDGKRRLLSPQRAP